MSAPHALQHSLMVGLKAVRRSAPRLGLRFAVGNQDTDVRLSFS
jgi:hypothetical protein